MSTFNMNLYSFLLCTVSSTILYYVIQNIWDKQTRHINATFGVLKAVIYFRYTVTIWCIDCENYVVII